jgi:hypothetical protein
MREAVLDAITVPASVEIQGAGLDALAPDRVTVHAVALQALLSDAPNVLTPTEQALLGDWLDRLAMGEGSS